MSKFESSTCISREAYVRMINKMEEDPTRHGDELVLGDNWEQLEERARREEQAQNRLRIGDNVSAVPEAH